MQKPWSRFNPLSQLEQATGLRMYEARDSLALMLTGATVGALSGLAAVALNLSVHWMESWRNHQSMMMLLVLPALGAGAGILIQRHLFRDQTGHGVPDVIESVTTGRGFLPRRLLGSRLISSFLTVGSGGAAGLEGPIVVSGAAIGSIVSRMLHVKQRRRMLLIACGTSGAIAGIFNAPLTGLVFSLEVILGEWKARNLVPSVTAAVVATQVSRMLMGNKIPFPREALDHGFIDIPACALLGVICALCGRLFVDMLGYSHHRFSGIRLPRFIVAGIGGLCVGLVGAFWPDSMGEGYQLIAAYIEDSPSGSLFLVGFLLALRLVTTSLTLGSGGAGGVFAPSLVFGSSLGLMFGRILQWLQLPFASPGAYALMGMAGFVAGIMNAPLTGVFLVLEICGGYDLVLPLMMCSLVSMLTWRFMKQGSIYTNDMIVKGAYLKRGSEAQLFADMEWSELVQEVRLIPETMTLGEFVDQYGTSQDDLYGVNDSQGKFTGLLFSRDIRPYFWDRDMYPLITMSSLVHQGVSLTSDQSPVDAWNLLGSEEAVPVLNSRGELLGVVNKIKLFDTARREMAVHEES
ncbi:MAG: chloride channel protein [Acidobacteria bacterium]|nr:chloride channel protein [Acidobacteriota bacterium]